MAENFEELDNLKKQILELAEKVHNQEIRLRELEKTVRRFESFDFGPQPPELT